MTADFLSDAERSEETRATASDDAFARLEKEMAAMQHGIGGLSDQIAEAASDIGAAGQEPAKQGLKFAAANVDSMVAGASDQAGAVARAVQLQASWIGDTLEDTVRERPLPTVAIALGLGFLIGLTLRR